MSVLHMRPVVYSSPALIGLPSGDAFREVIAPNALAPALERSRDVVALRDHNPSLLLGRTDSRTLKLTHLPMTGLQAEVDVPNTELGRETSVLVGRGDLTGCSFSFRASKDRWFQGEDGDLPTRVITEISHIGDVSVCTLPAYESTSVWVRSASQPADDWLAAADGRTRRLALLEADIIGPTENRWGRPIAAPSWWHEPRLARRGCGHIL